LRNCPQRVPVLAMGTDKGTGSSISVPGSLPARTPHPPVPADGNPPPPSTPHTGKFQLLNQYVKNINTFPKMLKKVT